MYSIFFKNINIYGYIEYIVLCTIFGIILYENRNFWIINYAYKYGILIKLSMLILIVILSIVIYTFLAIMNISWIIEIACNSLFSIITLALIISVFIKQIS